MADVFSKEKRSEVMSRIKGKNTKPELIVRQYLFSKGLRYRIHVSNLPGKPDIVLPKFKTAIFINGCFWHGHESDNCKISRMPKSNIEFWNSKIKGNKIKDQNAEFALQELGWKTMIVWECCLKSRQKEIELHSILNKIQNNNHVN